MKRSLKFIFKISLRIFKVDFITVYEYLYFEITFEIILKRISNFQAVDHFNVKLYTEPYIGRVSNNNNNNKKRGRKKKEKKSCGENISFKALSKVIIS